MLGFDEMKHFQYSAQGCIREIFLALGSSLPDNLLGKVKKAYCFGLLTDEVTDVSVLETLITVIQFFNKTGNIETSFLFIEDVRENSTSANGQFHSEGTGRYSGLKIQRHGEISKVRFLEKKV